MVKRVRHPEKIPALLALVSVAVSLSLSCPAEPAPAGPVIVILDGTAEVEADVLPGADARLLDGDTLVGTGLGSGVSADGDTLSVVVGGEVVVSANVADVGEFKDAVAVDSTIDDDTRLIATSGGLFSLRGSTLAPSPLGAAVVGVNLLASHPGALWLASASGDDAQTEAALYRYSATDLVKIPSTPELPLSATRLVAGASIDGHRAALVIAGDSLIAIIEGDTASDLQARTLYRGDLRGVAVTGAGDVWFGKGPHLAHRRVDGSVDELVFDSPVVDVAGVAGSADLWVATTGGLIHGLVGTGNDGAVFRDAGGPVTSLRAGAGGNALVTRDGGLLRLIAGRSVRFSGVVEAGLLQDGAATNVTATALPTALGGVVEVSVDGGAAIAGPVALDPAALFPGPHTLTATARYPDGVVVVAERVFFAGTRILPTWDSDVRVIYDNICSRCHSQQGGAHLLDESPLWRAEIDQIVAALDGGVMPPGSPLDDDDRRTVRLWRTTGMRE